MALTIHDRTFNTSGNVFSVGGQIDFDASYPTGGEPFSIDLIAGRPAIELISFQALMTSGFNFQYDHVNNLLLVYYTAGQVGTLAATVATATTGTVTTLTGTVPTGVTGSLTSGVTTLDSGAVTGSVTDGSTTATAGAATASAVDLTTPTGDLDDTATTGTVTTLTGTVPTATTADLTSGVTTMDSGATTGTLTSGVVTFSSETASVAAGALGEVANATNLALLVNVRYTALVRC